MSEERLARIETAVARTEANVAALKGDVETLNERLWRGNGGKSLMVRIELLEQTQVTTEHIEQLEADREKREAARRWHIRHLWAAIGAVVATIVAGWIFGGGS